MKLLEMIENPILWFVIGLLLNIIFRNWGGDKK